MDRWHTKREQRGKERKGEVAIHFMERKNKRNARGELKISNTKRKPGMQTHCEAREMEALKTVAHN